MGYTDFTINRIAEILQQYPVRNILDLGAQNNYSLPLAEPDKAPYMRAWYEQRGLWYLAIDLNGEDGALQIDLSKPWTESPLAEKVPLRRFDLVVDAGTSEHVGRNGAFGWDAIYNCWLNKHNLLGGRAIMYNENPKTGNWPKHGFQYYSKKFYHQLAEHSDYKILHLTEHAAMNNTVNGWNVVAILEKRSEHFPSIEEFQKMAIFTS